MNQTFTIDLNTICSKCRNHHAISGTTLCPHCTGDGVTQPPQRAEVAGPDKPKPGLRGTLLALIVRCEKLNDKKYHSIPLNGGLLVEVGMNTEFTLRLSRPAPQFASDREWQTVVDYLPPAYQPAQPITPARFGHGGRSYIEAHWKV
jgi:hypothetical protein